MAWLPSGSHPLSCALFHFLSNNKLAITLRNSGLISLLISRGRYTSLYYQQAVSCLLIRCCYRFPLQLSSSVWSPQSIEFSLQQFCLPFLRLSCLLQHHLYGDNLTGCLVCFVITYHHHYICGVTLKIKMNSSVVFCLFSGGRRVLINGCVFRALTLAPPAFQHRAQCLMSGVGGQRLRLGDAVVCWGHRAPSDACRAVTGACAIDSSIYRHLNM